MEAEKHGVYRIAAIIGMAALWPSLFNQLLYPVTFTYNRTQDPAVFPFFLEYSVLVILVTVILALGRKLIDRTLLANGHIVSAFGILGALGITLLSQLDFSSPASIAGIGIGVGFVALYVPVHFLFWTMRFTEDRARTGLSDMALSMVVFCAFVALRLLLGIHALYVTIACPLISTAAAAFITKDKSRKTSFSADTNLKTLPFIFIGPLVLLVILCCIGIIIFNGDAALQTQPPNRYLLYVIAMIFFALVAAAYYPRNSFLKGASLALFSVVTFIFVASLLFACLISADNLAAGTVPLIASNMCLVGFTWIVLVRSLQRTQTSPSVPTAFFLIFVLFVPRAIRAGIMHQSDFLPTLGHSMELFTITSLCALIAVALVIAIMMIVFRRMNVAPPFVDRSEPSEDQLFAKIAQDYELSSREIDIARYAAKNCSAKQTANELFIAESTVYTHLKRIYRKMGVHSRQELIDLVDDIRRSESLRMP